ncbi:hypothetical protein GCM10010358_38040 [Streptomyces minutiscleroticus]|uniref:Aminoacyl-transfer RNA synthetases class-II family profile domain-containing protein n=1 Tax=Streptomyces minutiscleroticus TaxID=68238 RepID=A0A918NM46_9ACTN|nr:hypothetical protein GCM10010358_38040 [Streptomyces minutiscleroticus]
MATPVPLDLADELARRIYFTSDAITGFSMVTSGDAVTAVDVTLAARATDPVDLGRKLDVIVASDVLGQRRTAPAVVWHADASGPVRDVFDELLAMGAATESGPGQIAVGEPVLSLMDHLDARLRDVAAAEFTAQEFRYPTLLPADALLRTGYAESFPQLLMFVSRLHGDVDSYRGFLDTMGRAGRGAATLSEGLRAHGGGVDHCLPPTMCFHTYHQYADGSLPAPSLVVTSRGKSFRHESRYHRSLERLWDFTIREVVFLGPVDFVLDCRSRLMERTYALMESLGLGGRCEVAGDPFFLGEGTTERSWSQRLLKLKYELRLPLDDADGGRDVAVGSFNYHEQHFAKAFAITGETGEPVFSGCAGFGLERLAYAFLCRHGVDARGWPKDVRAAVAP